MWTSIAVVAALAGAVAASPLLPISLRDAGPFDEFNCQFDFNSADIQVVTPANMIPISSKKPNKVYGDVQNPIITPNDFCTIFNLYIPGTAAGKVCTLEFLFPKFNAPYKYKGNGTFSFSGYTGYGGSVNTTWNTQPPEGPPQYNPPNQTITPGHKYVLNQPYPGSCLVNSTQDYLEVGGRLCSDDTFLEYIQQTSPCPIGFYIEISDSVPDNSTGAAKTTTHKEKAKELQYLE